ncbi:hypothetical protein POL68_13865 [Stigmatella sp. ncwal1]|uniref:Uncharacterized protein n=1 Tax=Stigmatella ashevillensis TaxID=2995309 RepID=A0ABT5D7B9_9BACT|nr:hypothetical protein [Stigmatella ashevillena]MDC0709552.1 hypothetical protein [Stigmatella ashevillena]
MLLQTMVPGTPYDGSRVDALLVERGVTARPDGTRVWRLKAGDVELGELRENGLRVATELRVPLSEKTELIREAMGEALMLAALAEVRLVDPQLGRSVTIQEDGAVADQFLRTARYAGEMLGLPEAVAARYEAPPEGMQAGTKVLLVLIAALFLLYFLVSFLLDGLRG